MAQVRVKKEEAATVRNIVLDQIYQTEQTLLRKRTPQIPKQTQDMLAELGGILKFRYQIPGQADRKDGLPRDFLGGKQTGVIVEFDKPPPLEYLAKSSLRSFASSYNIKITEGTIDMLAQGGICVIRGMIGKRPSSYQLEQMMRDIKTLEQQGVYVGILDDGRVTIANRAGYLMQQLANQGIGIEASSYRQATILNRAYLPSIPNGVYAKLERGMELAREKLNTGDYRRASDIIDKINRILDGYRTMEAAGYDSILAALSTAPQVKLSLSDWEQFKRIFTEDEFRRITGMSFAEFEKTGLNLVTIATRYARDAREQIIGANRAYENWLDAAIRGAPRNEMRKADAACTKAEGVQELAQLNTKKMAMILYQMMDIQGTQDTIRVYGDYRAPGRLREHFPDIADMLETESRRCVPLLESGQRQKIPLLLYGLAYQTYWYGQDEKKLRKMKELMKVPKREYDRSDMEFRRISGSIGRIESERLEIARCRTAKERLSTIEIILDGDPTAFGSMASRNAYVSTFEKDLVRSLFRNIGILSLHEAVGLIERVETEGMKSLDPQDVIKYKKLMEVIAIAHIFTWRYRIAQLIKLGDDPLNFPQEIQRTHQKRLELLAEGRFAMEIMKTVHVVLTPSREVQKVPPSWGSYGIKLSEGGTVIVPLNSTAWMDDQIKILERQFGRPKDLDPVKLVAYSQRFMEAYKAACEKMPEEVKEFEFQKAVANLPTSRQILAISAKVLDDYGDGIMWTAAAAGFVAGIFDSGGTTSALQAIAARQGIGAAIKYAVKYFGVGALRGTFGALALSGRTLALANATTAGLMDYATRKVPEEERQMEREMARGLWMNSVQYGIWGLMGSTPPAIAGLRIPPRLFSALGFGTNAVIFGRAIYNMASFKSAGLPEGATPAQEMENALKKAELISDGAYVALAVAIPGFRFARGFIRGAWGYKEVGGALWTRGAAAAGAKEAMIDLKRLYGATKPAFVKSDILLGGFMVGLPVVFDPSKDIDSILYPEERARAKLTPHKTRLTDIPRRIPMRIRKKVE